MWYEAEYIHTYLNTVVISALAVLTLTLTIIPRKLLVLMPTTFSNGMTLKTNQLG